MDETIKVLIADDIQETRNVIKQLVDLNSEVVEIVAEAKNGVEAVAMAKEFRPDLILMDINMPELNGLEAATQIMSDNPNSIIIIMSVQNETEYLKQAMFSGAKEYIIKPFDYDTLMNTLLKTYERYQGMQIAKVEDVHEAKKAKTIAFFSTKGGVGKTFLSTNLAIATSTHLKNKTLLIDLDLQFGDVALIIDKPNAKTIYDLVTDADTTLFEMVQPYFVQFNPNLDILLAPRSPEEAETVSKTAIESLLQTVNSHYDLILIDLPISFNDMSLNLLDMADVILYISSMDLLSLKNTRTGLTVMKSLNYSKDKVKLIINKTNETYGIKRGDVEKLFGFKPFMNLVDDEKSACLSINMGIPFLMNSKYKNSKLFKEIIALSEKFN